MKRQEVDISLTDTGDGRPGATRLGRGVWLGQKKARESGRGVRGRWWDHEVGARLRGSLRPGKRELALDRCGRKEDSPDRQLFLAAVSPSCSAQV